MKLFIVFCFSLFSINVFSQPSKNSNDCYDWDVISKREPTELYRPHLVSAKSFGLKVLKNNAQIQKYIDSKKLKLIPKKMKGYRILNLEYSRPYLVQKAKYTLEKMGTRFYKASEGHYFSITSVTRTLEDQCRLRKVNENASIGVSSHNYGNSFDISYVRFDNDLKMNKNLEQIVEKVLHYYKEQGRIHYIKETQQRCYHVTVRNF